MLPRYVADQETCLTPVLPDVVKATQAYHMVVHADLRDLPKVRTAANHIAQKVIEARARFVPSLARSGQSEAPSRPAWFIREALAPLPGQGRESASVLERGQPAVLAE
jgi:hypothetical protein